MDAEGHLAETVDRFQRAVASVRNDIKGLPLDVATEQLLDAMRHEDVYVSREVVRNVARQLSDPWWYARHPFRAWREMRSHEPDTERARLQAETHELSRRIGAVADRTDFNSLSIQSRRTVDGHTHVVYIDPWSASMAQRIIEAAAPIPVDVRSAASN